jgi:hypothetical protein
MIDKIYFAAGGIYALIYNFGAIKELHAEYYKSDSKLSRKIMLYGNSAGAISALLFYMIINNMFEMNELNEIYESFKCNITMNFHITSLAIKLFDNILIRCPDDLYTRVSDVIHIGITTKNGHKFISKFNSNSDIFHAILSSTSIPILSEYNSSINGEICIDGSFSFKYEYLPADTIIIYTYMNFPILLTFIWPPHILEILLSELGKQKVIYYMENTKDIISKPVKNKQIYDLLPFHNWIEIHELLYKNPMWNKYIEFKANDKISDSIMETVNLFDIVNYIQYSILNHIH